MELAYISGFLLVQIYTMGHPMVVEYAKLKRWNWAILFRPTSDSGSEMSFLPLMLTSVYCALGILYSWMLLYRRHWRLIKEKKSDE
jgi:hypothetical protein